MSAINRIFHEQLELLPQPRLGTVQPNRNNRTGPPDNRCDLTRSEFLPQRQQQDLSICICQRVESLDSQSKIRVVIVRSVIRYDLTSSTCETATQTGQSNVAAMSIRQNPSRNPVQPHPLFHGVVWNCFPAPPSHCKDISHHILGVVVDIDSPHRIRQQQRIVVAEHSSKPNNVGSSASSTTQH